VDAGVSGLLFNADVAPRGPEQETPIDMHPINASNVHGRLATRLSGAARLIFDPRHPITPRTLHAPVRSRLVRGHYSPACSISSPVAVNVSLRKEK
jgi:hypothetical protein